jgi:flagellar protein FlaJ
MGKKEGNMNLEGIRQKLAGRGEGVSKTGSNGSFSTFDLLYQLSYMSVIAAAGVPRKHIFESCSQLDCSSSAYFRKVELTSNRLGYDYARSCRVVGESIEQEEIRGLLLRFSSSLVSGEPEAEFLEREAEAQARAYDNEYGRKLESLRKWTDAYVSLILSSVLVVIIGLVSTMIWSIGTGFILGLVAVCLGTTTVGVWLIYLMSPREATVLHWAGSGRRRLLRPLKVLVPIAVVVCIILLIIGASPGWILLIGAALIFPVGYVAMSNDKKVTKKDVEVGPFLRSLGGVCSAIGTTVKEAVGRLDFNAINTLRPEVKRLNTRLIAGIKAKLCWQRFIDETGSELANRSMTMFYDAIELGGEAEKAGYHASLFASRIALLRAQRKTVTSPFRWLSITMHAAVTALLVFITEVVAIFGGMITTAQEAMRDTAPGGIDSPSVAAFGGFNFAGLEFMHSMVLPLILVFTVANALAPTIADGGSRWKILYDLGITAGISGASLVFLPTVAASMFSSIQM